MSAPWVAPEAVAPSSPVPVPAAAGRAGAGPGTAVARGDARATPRVQADGLEGNPLADPAPGGPGVVLDEAFALLRFRFRRLVGLAATVLVPVQLLGLLLTVRNGLQPDGGAEQVTANSAVVGVFTASSWVDLVVVGLRGVALAAVGLCAGHLAASWLAGSDPSYRDLVVLLARRSWVLPLVVLLGWCVKAPFLLLGGVGWFLGDALVFPAAAVTGAERLGPWAAVRRTIRLTRPAYGVAVVVCVGGTLITQLMQVALLLGPVALVSLLDPPEGWLLVVQQAGSLVLLVTVPLTACIAARAWVELRCRVEGLDLVHRAGERGWTGPS